MKINLFNKYEFILEFNPLKIRKKIKFAPCQYFPVEPTGTIRTLPDGCKQIWYPNGAIEWRDWQGYLAYIKYNTGDEVWFKLQPGPPVVVSIRTHDGVNFNYISTAHAPHQS